MFRIQLWHPFISISQKQMIQDELLLSLISQSIDPILIQIVINYQRFSASFSSAFHICHFLQNSADPHHVSAVHIFQFLIRASSGLNREGHGSTFQLQSIVWCSKAWDLTLPAAWCKAARQVFGHSPVKLIALLLLGTGFLRRLFIIFFQWRTQTFSRA